MAHQLDFSVAAHQLVDYVSPRQQQQHQFQRRPGFTVPLNDLHQYLCSNWRPHHRIEQVVVSFTLNANGKVSEAKIEKASEAADCNAEALSILDCYSCKHAWPKSVPAKIRIRYSLLGRGIEFKPFKVGRQLSRVSPTLPTFKEGNFMSLPPVLKTFKIKDKEQYYFYGQVGLDSITPEKISK